MKKIFFVFITILVIVVVGIFFIKEAEVFVHWTGT